MAVHRRFGAGAALVLVIGWLLSGDAVSREVTLTKGPQPDPAALAPGLAVVYWYGTRFEHIDDFYAWDAAKGRPGPALLVVDYDTGSGRVLTSDADDEVGARITGFLHFERPGRYAFAFESNDGVRFEMGGQLVLEDPWPHRVRYTETHAVVVTEAGWYPLKITYFEQHVTSTLRFFWLPSGGGYDMVIVPGSVLAHLKE